MLNRSALEKIIADPNSTEPERDRARQQLEAAPGESPLNTSHVHLLESELLRFSGAHRLRDVLPETVFNFYDSHRPASDELTSLAALWKLLRVLDGLPDVTEEMWNSLTGSVEQRKREFESRITKYPFLAIPEVVRQDRVDEVNVLRGFCENFHDQIPRYLDELKKLLARMKPYEFQARRLAEIVIARCEGRDAWNQQKDQPNDLRNFT
jgi:hypothetical protein